MRGCLFWIAVFLMTANARAETWSATCLDGKDLRYEQETTGKVLPQGSLPERTETSGKGFIAVRAGKYLFFRIAWVEDAQRRGDEVCGRTAAMGVPQPAVPIVNSQICMRRKPKAEIVFKYTAVGTGGPVQREFRYCDAVIERR
jgi:hypothetical protein